VSAPARGKLWCVRHAPVAVTGVCYGHADVPLGMGEHEAARTIRCALDASGITLREVWCSPAARTRTVAEILAAESGASLHVDPRIAELAMGEWEGLPFAEIERTDAARFDRWMAAWRTEAPPGGETLASLVARVGAWAIERRIALDALDARQVRDAPRDVLAVTHAGVIRALRALLRGTTYEAILDAGGAVPHLAIELVAPS
jgi:alpha-ribazole phosphatase